MSTAASGNQTVISVTGLTKSFGKKTVVKDLDISVNRGEIFGFLGPNGSGKTTFIRMLCGLLAPDRGLGTCLGFDIVRDADKIKARVGYMAQRFSLYTDLTVRENLRFLAGIYGIPKPGRSVDQCMEENGLTRFSRHLAGQLSGGWKQRLALAACVLPKPQLLLLDEPTAGVDPSARRVFWDRIHELAGQGVTALISTHYMDEAERCTRLGYIAYGDLLAQGAVEDIVRERGLTTWRITGPDLHGLARDLRESPGVEQAAAFGNALHVSGRDPALIEQALAPHQSTHQMEPIDTSLEEVFIHLMRNVRAD
ncbi:MAG: ABC transporter ATP-binding protein [Desulfovibrio sp.]|nr:MAG: ABC transporter ATP-binding protein [Desulfovibrio sp.]